MPASLLPGPTLTNTKHSWAKVQGDLWELSSSHGKREEPKFLKTLKKVSEKWSAYEVTYTLDLNDRAGAARVPDMGYLAKTRSVDTVEATINAFHSNARFAISNQSEWADEGSANQIVQDLKFRSRQSMEAMVEQDSDYFWGLSSAVLATTNTNVSGTTATLTLLTGYNSSAITNGRYIAKLFRKGDIIALLAAGSDALIDANAWGSVTDYNLTNGTIDVTFIGSVTSYTTDGIRIVKANNLEQSTVAGGTDLNQGYSGITEGMFSTSVSSVSGSTYARWNPSTTDTASVRFNPAHLWLAKDNIKNETGLDADTWMLSQGVNRDIALQERAGLRYDDSMTMDFDGDVKAKGMKKWTMKNNPPGMVFVGAKEGLNYWEILALQGTKAYRDLLPYTDQAASVGRFDRFANIVWRSRAAWGYFTNKTEA